MNNVTNEGVCKEQWASNENKTNKKHGVCCVYRSRDEQKGSQHTHGTRLEPRFKVLEKEHQMSQTDTKNIHIIPQYSWNVEQCACGLLSSTTHWTFTLFLKTMIAPPSLINLGWSPISRALNLTPACTASSLHGSEPVIQGMCQLLPQLLIFSQPAKR